jgi:hypothetical protein
MGGGGFGATTGVSGTADAHAESAKRTAMGRRDRKDRADGTLATFSGLGDFMAKRKKPRLPSQAKGLASRRPENLRVPWFRLLRVAVLAIIGIVATGWAAHRALTRKPEPMVVPRPTAQPWPPPSTIDVTDIDLGSIPGADASRP